MPASGFSNAHASSTPAPSILIVHGFRAFISFIAMHTRIIANDVAFVYLLLAFAARGSFMHTVSIY